MEELIDYLKSPSKYFGEGHTQAEKLEKRKKRLRLELELETDGVIENILAAARLRVRFADPTIYIMNIGSSGSHWLGSILQRSLELLGGSEVYIQGDFLRETIGKLSDAEAKVAMQAIMLAHVYQDNASVIKRSIINTAHVADIDTYTEKDIHSYKILLTRDPVDIVVSRTFRKNEYRAYLGLTDIPDSEYARQNIKKVNNYYHFALKSRHNLQCSYESMCEGSNAISAIVEKVAADLSFPFDRDRTNKVIAAMAATYAKNANKTNRLDGGGGLLTRKYIA